MKLFYQYMAIFVNLPPTLHPLQVENCDSNSRLVVDENAYGKPRLERVNPYSAAHDYCRFIYVSLVDQITAIGNEMCV